LELPTVAHYGSNGKTQKNHQRQRILVVDHESAILELLKHVFEVQGFEVLTAQRGENAISLYRVHEDEIDLVLLETHCDGLPTLAKLRQINPDVKVAFMSGNPDDFPQSESRT
jgi:DNA-binding response OmpR family regulator